MSVAGRPIKRAIWWALKKSLDRRYKVIKVRRKEEQLDFLQFSEREEQNDSLDHRFKGIEVC